MDGLTLKDVLSTGTSGILAAGVWLLWVRLNTITDRLFTYLERGANERAAIAESLGMSTQDLSAAAEAIKQRHNLTGKM